MFLRATGRILLALSVLPSTDCNPRSCHHFDAGKDREFGRWLVAMPDNGHQLMTARGEVCQNAEMAIKLSEFRIGKHGFINFTYDARWLEYFINKMEKKT